MNLLVKVPPSTLGDFPVHHSASHKTIYIALILLLSPSPLFSNQETYQARDEIQHNFSIQTTAEDGKFVTVFSRTLAVDFQDVSPVLQDLTAYPVWILNGINSLNHT